jgi:hypothetical protein
MSNLSIILTGVTVILVIAAYFVYTQIILPKKALWRFFVEYRSFNKSFYQYLRFISKRNIEVVPLRMEIPKSKNRIIYGGFIILHGRKETFIKHMVFMLNGEEAVILFKQTIGEIEQRIFMMNSHTTIIYDIPIENEETIESLICLGYKKLRTFVSTYKVRMVKSKIMN